MAKREELIAKGFTEEQVTEILNLVHAEKADVQANATKLQSDLDKANSTIANLSKVKEDYTKLQQSQMSDQDKMAAMMKEAEEHLKQSKLIESKANAKTIFAEIGGIDDNVLDSIVSEDIEKTNANANALLNLIKAREENIALKTKESLLNTNVLPNTQSNVTSNSEPQMTKEEFSKLSVSEKTKIFKENNELWTKMTQS